MNPWKVTLQKKVDDEHESGILKQVYKFGWADLIDNSMKINPT